MGSFRGHNFKAKLSFKKYLRNATTLSDYTANIQGEAG